jgi:hypothetical protein
MDHDRAADDFACIHMMTRTIALLVLLVAACTTTEAVDSDTPDDAAGKADGVSRPSGVYSRRDATDGQLSELMLFPDGTFNRYDALGDMRIRGRYTFTRSTTTAKRYIRFIDPDGTLIDRYVYTMNGAVVHLHLDSETADYPMFSSATGTAAWIEGIETDWFDDAFEDWGAEAFTRTAIVRTDLPAPARAIYDQVASELGPNTTPLIYRFDLHGRPGFELDGGSTTVRLFDQAGSVVASGKGDSLFDFAWN